MFIYSYFLKITKLNHNPKVLNNSTNPKAISFERKDCNMIPLDVDQLVTSVIGNHNVL
jgi:hypothetical protein